MTDYRDDDYESVPFDAMVRLSDDLMEASKLIGYREARYLVDLYYQVQDVRKAMDNRVRACEAVGEPAEILRWVARNARALEEDIKAALGTFAAEYAVGRWLQSITGIGPVLSAGLLSGFDIRRAPTVGHWWSFTGYDPTVVWVSSKDAKKLVAKVMNGDKKVTLAHIEACGKEIGRSPRKIIQAHRFLKKKLGTDAMPKTPDALATAISVRPWNAKTKVLCWKVGDQIVRQQNRKGGEFYGQIYRDRKAYEQERNDSGGNAKAAAESISKVDKKTEAYKAYAQGKLPDGRIQMRAQRFAAKILLAHLHHVSHLDYYGTKPPKPYALTLDEHAHEILPPEYDPTNGKSLKKLFGEE